MRAFGSTSLGVWLACSVAVLPTGPGAAGAAEAFHVESRLALHAVLVNGELTRSEWTCPDRQSVELMGLGGAEHRRIVTRLDRRLIWTIDFEDSSYTEVTFALARSAAQLHDSLVADARGTGAGGADEPLGQPETLGVGERVGGAATVHIRRRGRVSFGPTAATGPLLLHTVEWWEARDLPGLDGYRRFAEARDSLLGQRAEGTPLLFSGMSMGGGEALASLRGGVPGSPPAYPMEVIVRQDLPPSTPGDSNAMAEDSTLRRMGIDPASHTWTVLKVEVVRSGLTSVPADRFELPPGFRREASVEERLLQRAREANRPQPGDPGPGK